MEDARCEEGRDSPLAALGFGGVSDFSEPNIVGYDGIGNSMRPLGQSVADLISRSTSSKWNIIGAQNQLQLQAILPSANYTKALMLRALQYQCFFRIHFVHKEQRK